MLLPFDRRRIYYNLNGPETSPAQVSRLRRTSLVKPADLKPGRCQTSVALLLLLTESAVEWLAVREAATAARAPCER